LSSALERGYALLIDYAASTGRRHVHGYRRQQVIEDVLADPGTTDITAGIDLDTVTGAVQRGNLRVEASATQRDALLALGFEAWIRDEQTRQSTLRDEGQGLDAVRAWSDRSRATLLAEPGGLGRLRWMLLATRDVPFAGDLLAADPAAEGTERE
jgi:SAM-dependent MidA family methyltransferase